MVNDMMMLKCRFELDLFSNKKLITLKIETNIGKSVLICWMAQLLISKWNTVAFPLIAMFLVSIVYVHCYPHIWHSWGIFESSVGCDKQYKASCNHVLLTYKPFWGLLEYQSPWCHQGHPNCPAQLSYNVSYKQDKLAIRGHDYVGY